MLLRTLGGLALSGASFRRPKPLFLLAFLALEGPKPRRYLAELFWPDALNPRQSLTVALAQLRAAAAGAVESDQSTVLTRVECDAAQLLDAAVRGDWHAVDRLDGGEFLAGIDVPAGNAELEEWLFGTREFLLARVNDAALALSEELLSKGTAHQARRLAERVVKSHLGGIAFGDEALARLHAVLSVTGSPQARSLRDEAAALGITLLDTARPPPPNRLSGTAPSQHNFAPIGTSFVGREAELEELSELITTRAPLLTITGLGGMGKSRLAFAVAQQALQRRDFDRAFFVPLAGASEGAEIWAHVASSLEVFDAPAPDPVRSVIEHIGNERLLLVLDNFEHLTAGARMLLEPLEKCPGLRLVITSREPLGLPEEQVYHLEGMVFPDNANEAHGRERYFDALQLFVTRARRTEPTFVIDESNLSPIIDICRLVAGSPLGIELAVSLVRSLPADEVAAELSQNLDFLSHVDPEGVDRHSSLRAVFDHSWRLLIAGRQKVLRDLSVFSGGFSRQAGAACASATIADLAALLDRSLLRRDHGRFEMHPLVRLYARERLQQDPDDEERVRDRHAEFYGGFLGARSAAVGEAGAKTPLGEVGLELDNARAAWDWAVRRERWDLVATMLPVLDRFHNAHGRHSECLDLMRAALQRHTTKNALWSKLAGSRVAHLLQLNRFEEARSIIEEELDAHRRAGSPEDLAFLVTVHGIALAQGGDLESARKRWQEGLAFTRQHGLGLATGRLLMNLAVTTSDVHESGRLAIESIDLAKQDGNALQLVWRLRNYALHLLQSHGPASGTLEVMREAVAIAHEDFGDDLVLPGALFTLCSIERERGDLDAADSSAAAAESYISSDMPPQKLEELRREAAHHRAHMFLLRGRPDSGLGIALDELRTSPAPQDHALLARLAVDVGDLGVATEHIAAIRSHSASSPPVRDRIRCAIGADLLET